MDGLFQRASFCKWVCPIGQFNFVASTLSPLEVQASDPEICARCTTKDCIARTLGLLFLLLLLVEPLLLLGAAAWMTRRLAGLRGPLLPLATRFAYALAPLGFGVWLAHYSFHLFTGFWTFIPVMQSALAGAGLPLLGQPAWSLGGLSPDLVHPLELGFLGLGLLGSLLVAWRIAEREVPGRIGRAFLPWAGLCLLLWSAAVWLLAQPMEMRGTLLGG